MSAASVPRGAASPRPDASDISLHWAGDLTVAVHRSLRRIGYIASVGPVFVAYRGERRDRMVEVAQSPLFEIALRGLREAAEASDPAPAPEPDRLAPVGTIVATRSIRRPAATPGDRSGERAMPRSA